MPPMFSVVVAVVAVATLAQPAAGSNTLCPGEGDFRYGDMVYHKSRGLGRLACRVTRPGVVGICQGINTGHDKYSNCLGEGHPSFCAEKSLWFVRCADLESRTDSSVPTKSRQAPPQGEAQFRDDDVDGPPAEAAGCGCSWNLHDSCQVSGQQTVDALTDDREARSWCGDPNSQECLLAPQIGKMAESFRHCLSLNAQGCHKDRRCQWAAQGASQCGIDEEQFMLQLVGVEHRNHPLLRMIMFHDHCNQLGDEQCDGDPLCQMQGSTGACDVKPTLTAQVMIANPRLILEWEDASAEAFCHAQSSPIAQSSLLVKPKCHGPCKLANGNCVLDHRKMKAPQLESIMNELCMQALRSESISGRVGDAGSCPHPCVFHSSGASSQCLAPAVTQSMLMSEGEGRPDSRHVMILLKIIQSSLMLYEQQCSHMKEFQCKVAKPTCSMKQVSNWAQDNLGALSKAALPTLGFKGVLHEAAEAVAAGKGKQFMEDFLQNHPETVKDLTGTLANRLKTLLTPATTTIVFTTAAPIETTAISSFPENSVPRSGIDRFQPGRPEGPTINSIAQTVLNPWFIAAAVALLVAICASVLFGFMCHAKLSWRRQRREMGGGLLEADATDCDMTTFTVENRVYAAAA